MTIITCVPTEINGEMKGVFGHTKKRVWEKIAADLSGGSLHQRSVGEIKKKKKHVHRSKEEGMHYYIEFLKPVFQ